MNAFLVNDQCDAQILFYLFISIYNRNKHIEENLCITLVIHQDSLYDARSTKCKIMNAIHESKHSMIKNQLIINLI